jgi:hypothetical protein
MDIRTLADDDLPAAHALWSRTDHLGPVPDAEVAGLRAFEPELVLAAHDGEGLVGVVLGSFDGPTPAGPAWTPAAVSHPVDAGRDDATPPC